MSGVLKSPTVMVCGSMCGLSFSNVSLMNVVALAFGAYLFRIESSFWKILPLMSMKCPSLSFFDNFGLEVDFIQY